MEEDKERHDRKPLNTDSLMQARVPVGGPTLTPRQSLNPEGLSVDDIAVAVAKIHEDLAWRGPNGKTLGHVVLDREKARALLSLVALKLSFQRRVELWLFETFPRAHITDSKVRAFRFLEEALELAQACDCNRDQAIAIVEYVYGRPKNDNPRQEIGGVEVTLAALCYALRVELVECAEQELKRCWLNIDKIRAKQAAKPDFSTDPLPGPT